MGCVRDGLLCPISRQRKQKPHAPCPKPLALPQLNLHATRAPRTRLPLPPSWHVDARHYHVFHKLYKTLSSHCSDCMPCDTAALACLTSIRLIVELATTPHAHPLISLLLTLPLCPLPGVVSHLFQNRSNAAHDPRTTLRRILLRVASSMPHSLRFQSGSCCANLHSKTW
jgi:hypothetical protein